MQQPVNLQQAILRSFVKPVRKAYSPGFRVARAARGWEIFDGLDHIGFILARGGFVFDLWSFSPFEPAVCFNEQPPGQVVDLYTLRNTCINLPITAQRDLVAGVDDPFRRLKTRWVRAADPPKPRRWRFEQIALPFRLDAVNSFEQALDPWVPEDCPILAVAADAWDHRVAHTGKRSLRLDGRRPYEWTVQHPTGAVCNVEPHTRYRFSAWVKTRNVERFARLELIGYEYTDSNAIESAHSAKLNGTRDWTRLEVELDSGDEVCLMPRFALYDTGTAWFDDVTLERVSQHE